MKVSELTGALLDYWVAKADGVPDDAISWAGGSGSDGVIWERVCVHNYGFNPSRSWEKGGPIIERNRISVTTPCMDGGENSWWEASVAFDYDPKHATNKTAEADGPTPLIAAMRAFVASKYGETVPDEVTA